MRKKKAYDVFVSYASEDKEAIARPLALELRKLGLRVWFDEFELSVGDSLRESIERGLASSNFGAVIFSPSFFKKRWPRKELNGLFSRELIGRKKRILPILHDCSVKQLTSRFPIQADRVALFSESGPAKLAEDLLAVIQPKLREPQQLRDRVSELSQTLIAAAKRTYPGYDFDLSMSARSGGKLEIRSARSDGSGFEGEMNITFIGEGVRKADEFLKTGKPQTWTTGEFFSIKSSMPFFTEMTEGKFSVSPPAHTPVRPVAVGCGEGMFPYLDMRFVRGGTEEMEFEIGAKGEPLHLRLVWPLKRQRRTFDVSISWDVKGYTAKKLFTLMNFLDGIAERQNLLISDLRGEIPDIRIPIATGGKLKIPFDAGARNIIRTAFRAEERFGVRINVSFPPSQADIESLKILDSLLDGTEIGVDVSGTLVLRKGESQQIDEMIGSDGPINFNYFSSLDGYPGYLPLFGTQVPTPLWGIAADCGLQLTDEQRHLYVAAAPGAELKIKVANNGRGRYRWASDFTAKSKKYHPATRNRSGNNKALYRP